MTKSINISVIIHGPQGCGKTRNAKRLAALFGLQFVFDEWRPGYNLAKHGVLYLTNDDPGRYTGVLVIDYDSAMRKLCEPPSVSFKPGVPPAEKN